MTEHPITPPPELVDQWYRGWNPFRDLPRSDYIATQAARWAADQELEACCEEMKSIPSPLGIPFGEMASNALRAARRPKPPSLKQQALERLSNLESDEPGYDLGIIRRALEQLDD